MIANYHTHTVLCRHAKGDIHEYVDTAIQNGLKILGFSDHVACDLSAYDRASKGIYISPRKEKELTEEQHKKLSIKCEGIEQWASALSGGNKQKVVIAKWLANQSRILIMDCPTRGIDIGVKAAIYRLMEELKADGCSIIMISEEMPEVIGMSDVMYIMKGGRITKTFRREEHVTEHDIIQYMV